MVFANDAVRIGRPELLRQLTVALIALHERELHNEAGEDDDEEGGPAEATGPDDPLTLST